MAYSTAMFGDTIFSKEYKYEKDGHHAILHMLILHPDTAFPIQ